MDTSPDISTIIAQNADILDYDSEDDQSTLSPPRTPFQRSMQTAKASEQIMLEADMTRMKPLTPINANQTLVSVQNSQNAAEWLERRFATKKILNSDYCVE